mmetsp:Transcript_11774/g.26270  ORF Transcript_11774/g.26270 Transcript_11774/m.26270 type:complete len:192 (+) Transcript_11774:89-664(+)
MLGHWLLAVAVSAAAESTLGAPEYRTPEAAPHGRRMTRRSMPPSAAKETEQPPDALASATRLRLLARRAGQILAVPAVAREHNLSLAVRQIAVQLNESAGIITRWSPSHERKLEVRELGMELATKSAVSEVAELRDEVRNAVAEGQQEELSREHRLSDLSSNVAALRSLERQLPVPTHHRAELPARSNAVR